MALFEKTILYYENAARTAQEGDDGTSYASGISATEIGPNTIGTGALTLAADVPTAATLIGCGVEFDSTQNRYVITDIELAMTAVGSALQLATGENSVYDLVVSGGFLYVLLSTSPGKVARINLTTFLQDGATVTLAAGETYPRALVADASYLYVGCFTSPGKVARINLTTFLQDGTTVTLAGGESDINDMVISGNYLFVGLNLYPGKVARINLTTFLQDGATVTLAAGESFINALATSGNYLYAGCLNVATGKIARINLTTFLQDGTTVTLAAGETGVDALAVSGNYLYVGCPVSPGKIARINITTFLQDGTTVTLATGENVVASLCASGNYLFVGCAVSPGKVARINLTTFLQDGATITMDTGGNIVNALASIGNYLYAGLLVSPGRVSKLRMLAEIWTHERFQTADIGDSFTIRAGLICAQQDTTYVAPYVADNALAPVFKGKNNSITVISFHLPNFLTDGGFESGAFLPSWIAEATNPWVIESATELEGAYSASWDLVASKYLRQSGTELLKKGVTYRLIYKAKSVTANPTVGAITVNLFQTTSNTVVDADAAATTPAITTTATWFAQDFVPDFDTDNWYLNIAGDSTKANGATEITMDEFYLYKKPTVNTLIIDRHNLVGKGNHYFHSYKMSPLRSTASADDYTALKAAFTIDTADTYVTSITQRYDPVYRLYLQTGGASFAHEIGEVYFGNYWQVPRYVQATDPYETNEEGVRTMKLSWKNLASAYRTAEIKTLLEKLSSGESIWVKWDTDPPILMTSARRSTRAPYTPTRIDLDLDLIEVL